MRFQALQEKEILAQFDQLMVRLAEQNANVSEEEAAADFAVALDEMGAI